MTAKGKFILLFWRYHSPNTEVFDTLEDAKEYAEQGEDEGSLSHMCITHNDEIVYIHEGIYDRENIERVIDRFIIPRPIDGWRFTNVNAHK